MTRSWEFGLDDALPWEPHPQFSAVAIASAAFEGSAYVSHVRIEELPDGGPLLITLTVDERMTDADRRKVREAVGFVLPPYVGVDWQEVKP